MDLQNLNIDELLIAVFAAFGGCSIRYGELYKSGKVNLKFYIVDALTAIFLGAFMYVYLTDDLHISVTHAALFNIIIGNLGSRTITIISSILRKQIPSILDSSTKPEK